VLTAAFADLAARHDRKARSIVALSAETGLTFVGEFGQNDNRRPGVD
jgi:hypothetical protein